MFPFVPVDSQTGAVDVFGNPVHGLYEFIYGDPVAEETGGIIPGDGLERSAVITNVLDETSNPKSVPRNHLSWSSTAGARIYDTGASFTRDPALLDYDNNSVNEWRNIAIINDNDIYDRRNQVPNFFGWLYAAPDGTTWSIDIAGGVGTFKVFHPDRVLMVASVRRYGLMKFSNAFWGILDEPDEEFNANTDTFYTAQGAAGLTDFDSLVDDTGFFMDANKDGSQALIGVGKQNDPVYNTFNHVVLGAGDNLRKSAGNIGRTFGNLGVEISIVYLVTLTGTPGIDFAISIAIHRDQAACAGTVVTNKNEQRPAATIWGGGYGGTGGTSMFSRPNLISPGSFLPTFIFSTQLGSSADPHPANARICGWERLDCTGLSLLDKGLGDSGEDTFRWWINDQTEAEVQPIGVVWEASKEYSVGENVGYNSFVFTSTFMGTTDALFEPGVSVLWPERWEIEHDAEEHDITDAPRWAEGTSYSTFDVVHDGAANYYISKGLHTSFTDGADPIEEDFSQPGVGSVWPRFWEGPFNILLSGAVWLPDKVMVKDWVIPQSYTEEAFEAAKTIDNATWRVTRTHVSDTTNKPGSGANWQQFWEQALTNLTAGPWVPPVRYGEGVNRVNVGFDPQNVYVAVLPHTATAANKPPSASWTEDETIIDCTDPLDNPFGSVSLASYHVDGARLVTQSMDFKIDGIFGWAHFKDSGAIKNYTVDVRYTRELVDDEFTACWDDNDNPMFPAGEGGGVWDGSITRGPASCTETLFWEFNVDGSREQEVFLRATATANGSDVWSENFESIIGNGWTASGDYTLEVFNDGLLHSSISETVTQANAPPGSTIPAYRDTLLNAKGQWQTNDYVNGWTFRFIENPYFDNTRIKFENAVDLDLPGAGLLHFRHGGVLLDAISGSTDAQFSSRPTATADQKALGEPSPSIYFVVYSPKLVGPLVIGHKSHASGTDAQYRSTAEPVDFPWVQYGVYGPDAESPSIIRLTGRSPLVGIVNWLQNADYGDDISCAYDPVTQKITRNNQYKVVYI